MRIFIGFVIFACLAFPVFSQSQNSQDTDPMERFDALSESLDSSITRSTSMLADYDLMLTDNGNLKMFSSYRKRYEELLTALKESEAKMDLLDRTNERTDYVRRERDNYDSLLTELKTIKTDYDNWLSTIR